MCKIMSLCVGVCVCVHALCVCVCACECAFSCVYAISFYHQIIDYGTSIEKGG